MNEYELKKEFRKKENVVGVLELTKKLIDIRSPSQEEEECSNFIVDWFEKEGIEAKIVDRDWNVVARVGKGKPTLLFNGHIDTVGASPLWEASIDSVSYKAIETRGRIYGRGASDMKSGLACMMYSIKVLKDFDLKGSVVFTGVTREECSLYTLSGTGKLIEKGLISPEYAIVGEPTVGLVKGIGEFFKFGTGEKLSILKGSTTGLRRSKVGKLFETVKYFAEKVTGEEIKTTSGFGIGGETDIRYLLDLGIECVVVGPGYLSKCHSVDEYVDLKKIVDCFQIYSLSAYKLLT